MKFSLKSLKPGDPGESPAASDGAAGGEGAGGKVSFSLKLKVLLSIIGLVTLFSVILAVVLNLRSVNFVEEQAVEDIDRNLAAFELLVEEEEDALRAIYLVLQDYPGLAEALARGDREATGAIILPLFQRLQEEAEVNILQVIAPDQRSFYRGHEPGLEDVDLSFRAMVRRSLEGGGQLLSGFEIGRLGFALRVLGPIYGEEGELLGTLEVGRYLDNDFLDGLQGRLGVNLTIFDGDLRVSTTVVDDRGERAVGTTITHPGVLEEVLQKGGRWAGRLIIVGGDIFGAYSAIKDLDGNVLGMLFAGAPAEEVDARQGEDRWIALLMTLLAIGVSAVVALFLTDRVTRPIFQLSQSLERLSTGDFTARIGVKTGDEIGMLALSLGKMVDSLKRLLQSAGESSRRVEESSENLASSSQEVSASLEQVAASVNQFSQNAQGLSANSQQMAEDSARISENSARGETAINDAVHQMELITRMVEGLREVISALDSQSQEIGQIVETIKGIADQTNLLALNAAIEAARAGEEGRGFAVVAEEVRKLAEQSADAASEITGLITATQEQSSRAVSDMEKGIEDVNNGSQVIATTGEIFQDIIQGVEEITRRINEVATAAEEISAGSQEVSASVQEQSATMEEVAAAAQDLRAVSDTLAEEMKKFQF